MYNPYLGLDTGMPGALLRITLGILLVIAAAAVYPSVGLGALSASLLVVLFLIKVFAGVARRVVSASPLVRSHWEWRRHLARYYDSYQWRKLVWFGTGILIGGALRLPGAVGAWILGLACVTSGGAAEMLWRRHGLGIAPPTVGDGRL
jgi:hypothetical protein